jgi:rhodanese-related sulfurtransferase
VFSGGLPSWKKGGNYVYSSPKYLVTSKSTKTPVVVVDVRSKSKAMNGHIAGAVSYTTAQLKKSKKSFPKIKAAPVIIYSDSPKAARIAFKTIRKWGYKNASIMEGGVTGWTKAGNKLDSGQLATKIVYVPKPVKGSIAVSEFKAIAKSMPADAVILDVRDVAEVSGGMIKGAINIPTQEVASRMSEIPKGKKVVIHCRSGIRASMAYQTLKEKGYDAFFLNAKISIAPDGSFEIDS